MIKMQDQGSTASAQAEQTQHTVILRGIPVSFPFEPYQVQKIFMERVIETLQTGSNALLESPTGTGKTLSLLCSSRAWQESNSAATSKSSSSNSDTSTFQNIGASSVIIYASRTHAQLEQAANELKRTKYQGNVILLESRETSCSHPQISKYKGTEQVALCREHVENKSCEQRERATFEARKRGPVVEIEELGKAMSSNRFCAYYYVRDVLSFSTEGKQPTLIFMPYNYLVDPAARRGINIPWANSVVVIDEAHNIEDVCEEACSFSLDRNQLMRAVNEIDELLRKCKSTANRLVKHNVDEEDLRRIKAILKGIADAFEKNTQEQSGRVKGGVLFDILQTQSLTFECYGLLRTKLEECVDALSPNGRFVDWVVKCISRAFELGGDTLDAASARAAANDYYRLIFEKNTSEGWRVNFWCFSAGVIMNDLKKRGVRSVIVASGTLTPIDSFGSSLRIPFPVKLESPHVVSMKNVWLGVVPTGVTKLRLNSSYNHRERPDYHRELGNTLISLAKLIPDGLLVFFPSYSVLELCLKTWHSCDIWTRMKATKNAIIVEERGIHAGEEYDRVLENGDSAMLLAVCRGKASEGMNFKDHRARGVIIVGIPFPSRNEPRVIHKRMYMDEARASNPGLLGGDQWYSQQGYRAVNQAIGRAIRHENDYGAIVLLDDRFENVCGQLSLWLRPSFRIFKSGVTEAIPSIVQFFKEMKQKQSNTRPGSSQPPPRAKGAAVYPSSSSSVKLTYDEPLMSRSSLGNEVKQNYVKHSSARPNVEIPISRVHATNQSMRGSMIPSSTSSAASAADGRQEVSKSLLGPSVHASAQNGIAKPRFENGSGRPALSAHNGNSVSSSSSSMAPKVMPKEKPPTTARLPQQSKPNVPEVKRPRQETGRLPAIRDYMVRCKGVLTGEAYSEFKSILAAYHAHDRVKSSPVINQRVIHLFARVSEAQTRVELIRGLSEFLPPVHASSLRRDAGIS